MARTLKSDVARIVKGKTFGDAIYALEVASSAALGIAVIYGTLLGTTAIFDALN